MFKWLKERKKKQLKQLQEEIQQEAAEQAQAEALDNPSGKDSNEPWVTIVGDAVSEDGLQLSLDWNDAFIKFLKAGGIAGNDDTQIVQRWLAMIAKQQADMLGQNHLELEGKQSEFE